MIKQIDKPTVDNGVIANTPTVEELKLLQKHLRAPSNNRRILGGMFIDIWQQKCTDVEDISITPVYTLKDENVMVDGKLYYSMKNIYLSYDHVPGYEYEFAKDVFGTWEHWVMLTEAGGLAKEAIERWREELAVRIQSKALFSLTKVALYEGSKGTPAARFLADRGWEVKRGRPSKDEVTRERKIAAGLDREVQEDMERLGLKLVKNT